MVKWTGKSLSTQCKLTSNTLRLSRRLKRRALEKIAVLSATSSVQDSHERKNDFMKLCDACPPSRSRCNGSINSSKHKTPPPTKSLMVYEEEMPEFG